MRRKGLGATLLAAIALSAVVIALVIYTHFASQITTIEATALFEATVGALLVLTVLGTITYSRRESTTISQTVIIQEGRTLGEPATGPTCPSCGHRFKSLSLEGELVKCPYCGSEVK